MGILLITRPRKIVMDSKTLFASDRFQDQFDARRHDDATGRTLRDSRGVCRLVSWLENPGGDQRMLWLEAFLGWFLLPDLLDIPVGAVHHRCLCDRDVGCLGKVGLLVFVITPSASGSLPAVQHTGTAATELAGLQEDGL
jgi:hypothetical protein